MSARLCSKYKAMKGNETNKFLPSWACPLAGGVSDVFSGAMKFLAVGWERLTDRTPAPTRPSSTRYYLHLCIYNIVLRRVLLLKTRSRAI